MKPIKEPTRLMVDIETTGLRAGCRVWQIGACVITPDLVIGESFLMTASAADEFYVSRDDPETIKWQQEHNSANWEESRHSIQTEATIIDTFRMWVHSKGVKEYWSQGHFDFPILQRAAEINLIPLEFTFYKCFDSRTVFNWHGVKARKDNLSHNALVDAHRQAELLIRCRKVHLFSQSNITPDTLGE